MGGGGGFIGNVFEDIGNAVGDIGNAVGQVIEGAGKVVEQAGNLVVNVAVGVVTDVGGVFEGAVTGNWDKAAKSALNLVSASVATAAIVAGVLTGNGAAIAAGVTMLDAQYNKGRLLHAGVSTVGNVETALFHSKLINENATYIEFGIQMVATIYGSYVGSGYILNELGGIKSMFNPQLLSTIQTMSEYAGYAYNAFQVYSGVDAIIKNEAYYKAKLKEYEEYLNSLEQEYLTAKENFFNIFTSTDVFRYLAGGDIYNRMGAGGDMYDRADVYNPQKFMLGFVPSKNAQINDALNPDMYFEKFAGNDNFKGGEIG